MMEFLIVVTYAVQAYFAYWAWRNLPPAAGMPDLYRRSRIALILTALLPFGIVYQLVAFGIAKFYAARAEKATQRLAAAPSSFGGPAARPAVGTASASAGTGLPPGSNPFAAPDTAATPATSSAGPNPFADAEPQPNTSGSPAGEGQHQPPSGGANPFL